MKQGPVFKYKDIVRKRTDNTVYYIMDYNKKDDMYYYDDLEGNGHMSQSKKMHELFDKIGETTFDVLKKSNPSLKEKRYKYRMSTEEKILNNFLTCVSWIEDNVINSIQVPCTIIWTHYENNKIFTNTINPGQLCDFHYNDIIYHSDSSEIEKGCRILRDLPQWYRYSFILCWNDIKNQLLSQITTQRNTIDNFNV